jgi:hypothetical protein
LVWDDASKAPNSRRPAMPAANTEWFRPSKQTKQTKQNKQNKTKQTKQTNETKRNKPADINRSGNVRLDFFFNKQGLLL